VRNGFWLFRVSARTYYDEDSMMLSDDITMLSDLLLGLNSIDFRLNATCLYVVAYVTV